MNLGCPCVRSDARLVAADSEARCLTKQGGVKADGEHIIDGDMEVTPFGEIALPAGKRRFARIIFT
jgi:tyrosyl-tRNA synthetase